MLDLLRKMPYRDRTLDILRGVKVLGTTGIKYLLPFLTILQGGGVYSILVKLY